MEGEVGDVEGSYAGVIEGYQEGETEGSYVGVADGEDGVMEGEVGDVM